MYLRCSVQDAPKTWKSWLPLAEIWYNSSFHSCIGCSPFKALYDTEPHLGVNIPLPPKTQTTISEIIDRREQHLQLLKQRLEQSQNQMKYFADKNRTDTQFTVGD